MKKVFFVIILMICWVTTVAQQQVIYGTVQTDGYNKITKGAFWSSRPEARMVYNGDYPDGVEVVVLETDYFVRFAKGENNHLDINYIVFPKGERVYKKNGQYYSAKCGNRIDFIQPTNLIQIKEVEKRIYLSDTPPVVQGNRPVHDDWRPQQEPQQPTVRYEPPKTLAPKIDFLGIGISLVGLAGIVYGIVLLSPQQPAMITTYPNGNPGGNPGGTPTGNTGGGPGGTPPSRN